MRAVKIKSCQGNMNILTYILLIMDAWPVNVRIFVVSAYIESNSVVQTERRFQFCLPVYPVSSMFRDTV